MAKTVTIPTEKFAQLADFLQQASNIAREISQTKATGRAFTIPTLKRPKNVPKDQEWFWSEEWQKGEREANADMEAGRIVGPFDNVEELIADLNSHV